MSNTYNHLVFGIKWTSVSSLIAILLHFLQYVILARILSPNDFGMMAIVISMVSLVKPILNLGLNQAIIQSDNISANSLKSIFSINLILGISLFSLCYLAAPVLSSFFDSNEVNDLFKVAIIAFLFIPFGSVQNALLNKQLKFDLLSKIQVSLSILGPLVAISLAVAGYGVWSLVIAWMAQEIIGTTLFAFYGKQFFVPAFSRIDNEALPLIKFGLYQTGSRFLNMINSNLDNLFIGRFLGLELLGFYSIAYNLVIFPIGKINPIINQVVYPLYSKIKNKQEEVKLYYVKSLEIISLFNLPIYLLMFILSHEIITTLFGAGWNTSISILILLAAVGYFKSIGNLGGSLLLSKGKASVMFYWNIFWTLLIFIGLLICSKVSSQLESYAITILVVNIIAVPIWHFLIIKFTAVSYKEIIGTFIKQLGISIVILLVYENISHLLSSDNSYLNLITKSAFILLLYFGLAFIFFKRHYLSIIKFLKSAGTVRNQH